MTSRRSPRAALCLAAGLSALLLAGCFGSKPKAPPPAAANSGVSPAPVATPAPAGPAHAPAPAQPPSATAVAQAQKIAQGVVDLLELGNEEQAYLELQRALEMDPGNKLALNLSKQMSEDPVATLGRESFPYVVRPGDTLSRIAGRFLGDIYAFHLLARYNNIKVPRQVGEGQTIRIPGKAPPPSALQPPVARETPRPDARRPEAPAPAPAEPPVAAAPAEPAPSVGEVAFKSAQAAAAAGQLDKALADYKRAAAAGHPTAGAQADATARRLVEDHSRAARAAMARQDLDGAIRAWDKVLAIDPVNETARLERQKALRLKDKVKAL